MHAQKHQCDSSAGPCTKSSSYPTLSSTRYQCTRLPCSYDHRDSTLARTTPPSRTWEKKKTYTLRSQKRCVRIPEEDGSPTYNLRSVRHGPPALDRAPKALRNADTNFPSCDWIDHRESACHPRCSTRIAPWFCCMPWFLKFRLY